MPFDITQLNGVTFSNDNLTKPLPLNVPQPTYVEFSNPSGTDQIGAVYIDYLAALGLTVTNAQNFYTAGFNANGNYYLPTFGSFTLTSTGSATLENARAYIHGFSSGALLVSIDPTGVHGSNLAFASSAGGGLPKGPSGGFVAILANYNLGSGKTSPAYGKTIPYPYQDSYLYYHHVYKQVYVDPVTGTVATTYNYGASPYNNNPHPPTFPIAFSKDYTLYTPPCFAEGVRVLTTEGEVRVEDLAEGDVAVTASGALRPVIWVGSRRVVPSAYPDPADVTPVRIRAGAFAPGRPSRDLLLSPGHAVFVPVEGAGGGVLVPAARLVNGATIVQEPVERVRYFHVELDAHDVLVADGLPCESFLDDGNRATFANALTGAVAVSGEDGSVADLFGRLDPLDRERACAPVLRDGDDPADAARLAAIRSGLRARAEAMGWVAAHRGALGLRLADGARLDPLHAVDGRAWFMAPAGEVRLVSAAARPCEFAPVDGDRRRLGVAVSELRLDGVTLPLDGPALGAGFHPVERDAAQAWRWTDGEAALTLPAAGLLEVATPMLALTWDRADPPRLRLVAG